MDNEIENAINSGQVVVARYLDGIYRYGQLVEYSSYTEQTMGIIGFQSVLLNEFTTIEHLYQIDGERIDVEQGAYTQES